MGVSSNDPTDPTRANGRGPEKHWAAADVPHLLPGAAMGTCRGMRGAAEAQDSEAEAGDEARSGALMEDSAQAGRGPATRART